MLLEKNVAPEQARMVLPQSMYTSWIETGSLMAYARLCRLRLDGHTQSETRDLAKQINEKMAELFPVSWSALIEDLP
jgi:thymidylate synthase (FAD)